MLVADRGGRASAHLDMIRGLAAIGVFLGHARNLFFVDYRDLTGTGLALKGFYFATGLGHSWVMVFFVMSGFFISGSVIRDVPAGRWSWAKYSVTRCTRLYMVLVPALLLTVCWDRAGMALAGEHSIYSGGGGQNCVAAVADKLSPAVFLGNCLFLETLAVPPLGSNGPLWSLANEFWYYALFPVVWLVLRGGYSVLVRLALLGLAAVMVLFTWPLMAHFPIWLLGVILVVAPRLRVLGRRVLAALCGAAGVVGVGASLAVSYLHLLPVPLLADYLVAVAFTILMYCVLHTQGEKGGDSTPRSRRFSPTCPIPSTSHISLYSPSYTSPWGLRTAGNRMAFSFSCSAPFAVVFSPTRGSFRE